MVVNILGAVAFVAIAVGLKYVTTENQLVLAWMYIPLFIGWALSWTAAAIADDADLKRVRVKKKDSRINPLFVVALGITVLLATFLPIGSLLVDAFLGGTDPQAFAQRSPALFDVAMLLANYLPAALIAVIFIYKSQLSYRLPGEIPGTRQILIGLSFLIATLLLRLYVAIIPGGRAAFLAIFFNLPPFIVAADLLIIIGLTRALAAAFPPSHRSRA